ncbi:hypothetical protein H6775_03065 [Candidatus Nomurabacteria bacterium]|nr:hypothetical protein [Candidatus Nomurabacteria bacterium]
MKIEIIPAIMPDDFDDLVEKLNLVNHHTEWVQVDVMDGKLTRSISWPYSDKSHFDQLIHQDEGLPHWQNVNFEVDMMIANPVEEIPKWIEVGVSRIIVHLKTLKKEEDFDFIKKIKAEGLVEISIAINIGDNLDLLEKLEGYYDAVQFMGIERIGFQGEEFQESVLDNIADFRNKNKEIPISIDGGVNFDNVQDLVKAGVTRIVSGSLIFESGDVKGTIDELERLANK